MKAPYVFNLSLLLLILISYKVSGRIIIRTPERLGALFKSKSIYNSLAKYLFLRSDN